MLETTNPNHSYCHVRVLCKHSPQRKKREAKKIHRFLNYLNIMEMNEKIVQMRKGFKGKMEEERRKVKNKTNTHTHTHTPAVEIIRDMKFIEKPLAACFCALPLCTDTLQ